ncbi:tyrosine-type recombinase/integrase [Amycolatopsis sp. cmx-4-83]|uniref:tyrosine-type recombinase/integrase n=1 Tax=Amycolatopsis sp. cmx-4-83 TaxID=2790940 RepID=UPI00397B03A1
MRRGGRQPVLDLGGAQRGAVGAHERGGVPVWVAPLVAPAVDGWSVADGDSSDLGAGRSGGDLFTEVHGQRPHWSPSYVSHPFRRLIVKADLPPVRFHDLRHGAATLSLAAGNDLKAVQVLLGHTSVLPSLAQACAETTASLVRRAGYDRRRKICRSGARSIRQRRRRAVERGPRWQDSGPDPQRPQLGPTEQQSPPTATPNLPGNHWWALLSDCAPSGTRTPNPLVKSRDLDVSGGIE